MSKHEVNDVDAAHVAAMNDGAARDDAMNDAAYVDAMKEHVARIREEVAMRARRRHALLVGPWVRDNDKQRARPLGPEGNLISGTLPPQRSSYSLLAWIVTFFFVMMSLVRDANADSRGRYADDERDGDGDDVELDIDVDIDVDRRSRSPTRSRSRSSGSDEADDDVHVDIGVGASPLVGGRSAPPIAEVLEAAYVAAGLDRDPTKSWSRRARVAALIPWVSVRAGWDANWREDDPEVGRSRDFEVRATWRLDRLVFDGRELQVSSIDMARRRERRRLASRVIRTYFTWRKLAAAAATVQPRASTAAEAAAAELDALTDGWFSERAKSPR